MLIFVLIPDFSKQNLIKIAEMFPKNDTDSLDINWMHSFKIILKEWESLWFLRCASSRKDLIFCSIFYLAARQLLWTFSKYLAFLVKNAVNKFHIKILLNITNTST